MLTNIQTIHLLKNFYNSAHHILTEICLYRNEIQIAENNAYVNIANGKNVNMGDFMKVSRGNHSPDKIAAKFQMLSADFLKLSLEDISFLEAEGQLIVALTQDQIASNGSISESLPIPDNMITRINLAGNDWVTWFPHQMPYKKARDYFADHAKVLMNTIDLIETAYTTTEKDIKDIIIPNTTLLLNNLGVEI